MKPGDAIASTRLGDRISKIATPIARALGMDCIDPVTNQLRPESACGKTRERLNNATNIQQFASAIYDRFWPTKEDNAVRDKQN